MKNINYFLNIKKIEKDTIITKNENYLKIFKLEYNPELTWTTDVINVLTTKWKSMLTNLNCEFTYLLLSRPSTEKDYIKYLENLKDRIRTCTSLEIRRILILYVSEFKQQLESRQIFTKDIFLIVNNKYEQNLLRHFDKLNKEKLEKLYQKNISHFGRISDDFSLLFNSEFCTITPLNKEEINNFIFNIFHLERRF